MKSISRIVSIALSLVAFVAVPLVSGAKSPDAVVEKVARTVYLSKAITWDPQIAYRSASLRVVGPGGFVHDREFGTFKPVFDMTRLPGLADGQYKFELVFGRQPSEELTKAIAGAQLDEDGTIGNPVLRSSIHTLREVVVGAFRIEGGRIANPNAVESKDAEKVLLTAADGTIRSSLCVGFDCIDNETFGFATIKLKENNTRILFEDTSTGTFPTTDWQLTANDSASGGLNKFSIEDITAARVPFTVEGGAPTNSLYVDSTGRVGLRTSTPVLDMHARTGNTPGIRLEQDGSSGFTPQTWDVAGNEANFFVRDVTNGSKLPFRIRPGAPTDSVDIQASGNVRIGANLGITSGTSDTSKASIRGSGAGNLVLNGSTVGNVFVNNDSGVNTLLMGSRVGIGTINPRQKLSIGDFLDLYSGAANSPSQASIRASSAGNLVLNGSPAGNVFLNTDSGLNTLILGANVGIGTTSPTHKLHVIGNSRIEGTLQVTGGVIPDYVFDPGFKIASIDEHVSYMWKNRHLPAVGPAQKTDDGRGIVNVFAHTTGMLEELEKAHIYIGQLHNEIKALRSEAAQREVAIRSELSALKARLDK